MLPLIATRRRRQCRLCLSRRRSSQTRPKEGCLNHGLKAQGLDSTSNRGHPVLLHTLHPCLHPTLTVAVIDDADSTVDAGGRHSYRRGAIDPSFYEKKLSGSDPLGASTKNSAYFVSDWTSDSHLTHYLTGNTMGS